MGCLIQMFRLGMKSLAMAIGERDSQDEDSVDDLSAQGLNCPKDWSGMLKAPGLQGLAIGEI